MTQLSLAAIVAEELAKVGVTRQRFGTRRARETRFFADPPGFGLRTFSTGRASYIVQTRIQGAMRTVTLGSPAVLSPALARDVARRVLLRTQTGGDPAAERARVRAAPAWADFLDEYWRRMAPGWKPSTQRSQSVYRRQHLDSAFADKFVDEIGEEDVSRWFAAVTERGGPGGANRTLDILGAMFAKAEAWGYRPDHSNPCAGVRRNRGRKLERFLSEQELARLGAALRKLDTRDPARVAAIRLILLTGCRKSEILELKWGNLKGRRLMLEDAKAGPRRVWLGDAARAVFDALPRGRAAASVFPGQGKSSDGFLSEFWRTVCKEARLHRLRIHDLRHTFASQAARSSETLPTIAKLLGHATVQSTARYAHLDDQTCIEANERIGQHLMAKTI